MSTAKSRQRCRGYPAGTSGSAGVTGRIGPVLKVRTTAAPKMARRTATTRPPMPYASSPSAAATKVPRDQMLVNLIGASVGPHVGPGAYGAVTLSK